MVQKISESVSVDLAFNHKTLRVSPKKIIWRKRVYLVEKLGLHHTYWEGRTLYHVFSVATKTLFLRLVLNTETLHWRLEEVADGF